MPPALRKLTQVLGLLERLRVFPHARPLMQLVHLQRVMCPTNATSTCTVSHDFVIASANPWELSHAGGRFAARHAAAQLCDAAAGRNLVRLPAHRGAQGAINTASKWALLSDGLRGAGPWDKLLGSALAGAASGLGFQTVWRLLCGFHTAKPAACSLQACNTTTTTECNTTTDGSIRGSAATLPFGCAGAKEVRELLCIRRIT